MRKWLIEKLLSSLEEYEAHQIAWGILSKDIKAMGFRRYGPYIAVDGHLEALEIRLAGEQSTQMGRRYA